MSVMSVSGDVFYDAIDSSNNEDTDSDDSDIGCQPVKPVSQYIKCSLREGIASAIVSRNKKIGIKRQQGHYRLENCHRTVGDCKPRHYTGKHWDVNGANLHRSTPGLTQATIEHEIEAEQIERIVSEEEDRGRVVSRMSAISTELKQAISEGEKHDSTNLVKEKKVVDLMKDDLHNELLHTVHAKQLELDATEERERQEHILEDMVEEQDELPSGAYMQDLMLGMSEANEKKATVHAELLGAFHTMEDSKEEYDHEQFLQAQDLKDAAMRELLSSIVKVKVTVEVEGEQRLRIRNQENFLRNKIHLAAEECMQMVHQELIANFASVQLDETEKNEKQIAHMIRSKERVMDELIKRYMTKELTEACAHEKAIRIKEASKELQSPDNLKVQVRNRMECVHIELLGGSQPVHSSVEWGVESKYC